MFSLGSMLLIALWGYIIDADWLYCVDLMVWLSLVVYASFDIKGRSVLMGFLLTFFLFLMSRDFVEIFFSYRVESFKTAVNHHAYKVYLIALITIAVLYRVFTFNEYKNQFHTYVGNLDNMYLEKISRTMFIILIGFSIAAKYVVINFVSMYSYYEYYTEFSSYVSNNMLVTILNMMERMMPVALSLFLACFPSKKRLKLPIILYVFYLLISLGTQARSTAMLGFLFLLIYFLFRHSINPEEHWFNKRLIFVLIISVPVLVITGSLINELRSGGENTKSIATLFVDFFYDQGVTSNVVKRAYMYKNRLNGDILYTFEFLRSGIFARIFGYKVYYGNSLEHALRGGSFAHSIAYIVLGKGYLDGQGTGSSYVAEFYQDYGYWGVVAGTAIYVLLISRIANPYRINENIWIRTIQLLLIQRIMWAPRGSFADIIATVFSVPVVFTMVAAWIILRGARYKNRYKHNRVTLQ